MTNVERVIEKYGELIVDTLQKRLAQGKKNASMTLSNSLVYKYSVLPTGYKIQVTGAAYLINVDRGRRIGAKMPPIKPIMNWIKVKPGLVGRGAKRPTQQALKSYAIAIAKNISKRGIKPFPLLSKGTAITKSTVFKQDIAKAQMLDAVAQLRKTPGLFKVTSVYKGR